MIRCLLEGHLDNASPLAKLPGSLAGKERSQVPRGDPSLERHATAACGIRTDALGDAFRADSPFLQPGDDERVLGRKVPEVRAPLPARPCKTRIAQPVQCRSRRGRHDPELGSDLAARHRRHPVSEDDQRLVCSLGQRVLQGVGGCGHISTVHDCVSRFSICPYNLDICRRIFYYGRMADDPSLDSVAEAKPFVIGSGRATGTTPFGVFRRWLPPRTPFPPDSRFALGR